MISSILAVQHVPFSRQEGGRSVLILPLLYQTVDPHAGIRPPA